jgi:hypothetical protein
MVCHTPYIAALIKLTHLDITNKIAQIISYCSMGSRDIIGQKHEYEMGAVHSPSSINFVLSTFSKTAWKES